MSSLTSGSESGDKKLEADSFAVLRGSVAERYAFGSMADEFLTSDVSGVETMTSYIGSNLVESRGRIKLNPGDKVHVSACFRALGPKPSTFYFGLKEFSHSNGYDQLITSELANRQGNACRVESYDEKSLELILCDEPAGWSENAAALRMAFYFDGDTTSPKCLPAITEGNTYQSISRKKIKLKLALPGSISSRIVGGVTKVMNHLAGASYNYAGACGEILDPSAGWVTRQFTVRPAPENSPNFSLNAQHFRPLATSVSVLVLANWGQGKADAELAVADIVATKLQK